MDPAYTVHSSAFSGTPFHSMTVLHAGTRYSIRISPESVVGTSFHSRYVELLAHLHQTDGRDVSKPAAFDIIRALQQLLWSACRLIAEAHANTHPPGAEDIQRYVRPPTVHIDVVKDGHGVVGKLIGDVPRTTSRLAQSADGLTNIYTWGIAPVPIHELSISSDVMSQHSQQTSFS